MRRVPTIDELHSEGYEQLAKLRHADLVDFAAQYFFQRKSWFTRAGLLASVGEASLAIRVLIAVMWAVPAGIAAAGAFFIATHGAGRDCFLPRC